MPPHESPTAFFAQGTYKQDPIPPRAGYRKASGDMYIGRRIYDEKEPAKKRVKPRFMLIVEG
jgi:hypothetical protein